MLKVWGRRNSINVQKVMWMVGELGLAHEHIDAGGRFGGLDTEEFTAMNPNRRIPVIDDDIDGGGTIVWESHSIVRYLAAKYGAGTFWPTDPGERAKSDMWMDWTLADLQPAFIGVFWNLYRTPEEQRNWKAIRQGIARSAILFKMLDKHLEDKPFVGGPSLTIADIPTPRDALAAEIKSLLEAAAFDNQPIKEQQEDQLVRRARGIIDRVADLAHDEHDRGHDHDRH